MRPDQGGNLELARLADDPEGFAQFYRLIFQRDLPQHARADWVEPLYAARAQGKGLVVEAFRGSSKTTTLSIAFAAFRLGQEPHKSVLLIQAGDAMAGRTSQQIADLIEHNPGWQSAFPTIEADRKIAWGVKPGYEVKNTGLPYEEWRALCARDKGKDPSLIGLGYLSRAIIGKHPTGLLVVDDIHDETNTRSARELELVTTVLKGTILPTLTPETWQIFVGTPWTENDVLAYLKSTGRFISVATPVYKTKDEGERVKDEGKQKSVNQSIGQLGGHAIGQSGNQDRGTPISEGDSDRVDTADQDKENIPAWPERFPVEEIEKARQLVGEVEFARMYLLDLKAAVGIHLRREWLSDYPWAKIDPGWPVVMGVDYASTADQLNDGERDYFAVAIGRALPMGGGVVLVDGYRAQLSQGEAEQKLKSLAAFYPTTSLIVVEAVGKGEEFFHLVRRDWSLPVVPMNPGGSGKGERFQKAMAPLFERGLARVADAETAFLRAFREEWVRWPRGKHDDTLDATYWMLMAAKQHLTGRPRGARQRNPLSSLGRG